MAFADWLSLLGNMGVRFLHIVSCFLRFLDAMFRGVELGTERLLSFQKTHVHCVMLTSLIKIVENMCVTSK